MPCTATTEPELAISRLRKVSDERLRELIESMRLDEERGAMPELQRCIDRCASIFAEADNSEIVGIYGAIRKRAASAFAFEAEHGSRSLFRHEHPFNQMLDQSGMVDLKTFPKPSEELDTFWSNYFNDIRANG